MKTFDKVRLFAAMLLVFAGSSVLAKTPAAPSRIEEKFVKQIVSVMNLDYPTIVESSIFVSLQAKGKYPTADFDKVIDKLEDLAKSGSTISVRYKAQLAAIYYNYYDLFKDVKVGSISTADDVFKTIANKIENNTFAIN